LQSHGARADRSSCFRSSTFGEEGKAEVDAVPVATLDTWVQDAIEALQDPARREELRDEEEQERKRLPDAIRHALDEEDELDDEGERGV
jgi:hypothetical protein